MHLCAARWGGDPPDAPRGDVGGAAPLEGRRQEPCPVQSGEDCGRERVTVLFLTLHFIFSSDESRALENGSILGVVGIVP